MANSKSPKLKTGPAKPRRAKRTTRGALAVIGGLLIASAVLRTAIGAGEAFARESPPESASAQPATEAHTGPDTADQGSQDHLAAVADPAQRAPSGQPMVQRIADEDLMPLIEALNRREARVKQREEDLDVRLQALSLAEKEINKKLEELEAAERQLRETLALAQTAAEDDLTKLTDVYANMKPKQAAALFEEMDPEFAAGFLGRMKPDAAAAIMAGLTPGTAYTISVVLAGRNANVPKQ